MHFLDPRLLLPPGLLVDALETGADRITISARPAATASCCPVCDGVSGRVHSRYQRPNRPVLAGGRGVPFGATIDRANRNDHKLMRPILEVIAVERPERTRWQPQLSDY